MTYLVKSKTVVIIHKELISEVGRLETALFEGYGGILNKDGRPVALDRLHRPLQDIPVIPFDINLDHIHVADSTARDESIYGCHGDRDMFTASAVPTRR